jgi:cytochrome c oxidase subunit 2
MLGDLPIFPAQASTSALLVDALYFFLLGMSAFGSLLVAGLLVWFAVKYHRKADVDRSSPVSHHTGLEILWTAIPLGLFMVIFFWGASVFFHLSRPPDNAMEIQVVGKRWMWKLQHLNGKREINELHVPVGRAVKLTMTSEDVIHSFFVPAFRIKADVRPGRYSTVWFEATKPGRYHLFCAEYCGTKHSQMIGSVVVMDPSDFQAWLTCEARGVSLAAAGEKLFQSLGCVTCHNPTSQARGPDLEALFGSAVNLEGGEAVVFNESYVRESIVEPKAKLAAGYPPIMPTFRGLVSEEGILQLIEYIKSIGPEKGETPPATGEPTVGASSETGVRQEPAS